MQEPGARVPAVDTSQVSPDVLHDAAAFGCGPENRPGVHGTCRSGLHDALPASGIERRGAGEDQCDSLVNDTRTVDAVVRYDYTGKELGRGDDPQNPADFLDQGGAEGIREVSAGSAVDLPDGSDDSGGRRQGGHRQADAGFRRRGVRDRIAVSGDAFRVVYAVRIGTDLWVVHAFQKKATQGIRMPKHEIDLIRDRLRRLKEMLE